MVVVVVLVLVLVLVVLVLVVLVFAVVADALVRWGEMVGDDGYHFDHTCGVRAR